MDMKRGIVAIKLHPQSPTILGTGFFVTKGLILTCAHVIEDSYEPGMTAYFQIEGQSETLGARVALYSPKEESDLALLEPLREVDSFPLPMVSSENSRGHEFSMFGYPRLGEIRGFNGAGKVLGWIVDGRGRSMLQLDSQQATHGFSGAPVWDEAHQAVIGILQKGIKDDEAGRPSFALPMEVVKQAYPELPVGPAPEGEGRSEKDRLAPKPTFHVPFPRNERFVGRDDDLERMHHALPAGDTVGIRPAMLSGMGGIGKTQLVVEYAYRYQEDYQDGVYWVNAAEDWLAGIASLAEKVYLRADDVPESQRLNHLAQVFFAFLKKHPRALLIFDNVEDPRSLRLPLAGVIPSELPCRVLFTTRRRGADLPFESIEVKALPEDAALELLLSSKSRKDSLQAPGFLDSPQGEAARGICRSLGCLPLAIALAAAYLGKHPDISLNGYRKRLEKEGLRAIDASGVDPLDLPTRHDAAVAATLAMQWETLQDENARLVIQAAALMGEAVLIPRARIALMTGLSEEAEEGYPDPLGEALQELHESYLVEELGPENIRLHPLVRDFVRRVTPDADSLAAACIARITESLWDMRRLDREITNRGVDAVTADIRSVLDPETKGDDAGKAKLSALLEPLDRESHHLREPFGKAFPGYCLQQIHNRAVNMQARSMGEAAEQELGRRGAAWFAERVPTSRESHALVRTFEGHTSAVMSVAITPDGKRALSGSNDHTLRLWDLESGQCLHSFEGHTGRLWSVAITPDGRWVLSGSNDQTLRLWDLQSGQPLRTFEAHTGGVWSLAITPDGRRALSGSYDSTLQLWDLESGQCLHTFEGHTDPVSSVAITPDGRRALSGSHDHTLRLWDLEGGAWLHTFEAHTGGVWSVAITPDGKQALSGSSDKTLRLWDLESGQSLRTFEGHTRSVTSVAITPDGRRALSVSFDNTLRLWDLRESGRPLHTFEAHSNWGTSVAVTPDGRRALSGTWDCTLRLWDLRESSQPLRTFEGHTKAINSMAITPDGRRALSGSHDHTLRLWDLESGQSLRTFEAHTGGVWSVAITPNGRRALSGSYDSTLRLWDLESGQALRTFEANTGGVWSVAITPDGRRALSGSFNHTLQLWDMESGQTLRTFEGHTSSVACVAVTPDGRRALSGSSDKTLRLWDLESGQSLRAFQGHADRVTSVAIIPDGRRALSGSSDQTLRLWDLESGQCLRTFEGHTGLVVSVAITPDGGRALSGSYDRTLRLWDLESGQCFLLLAGDAPFESVAVAPSAPFIVAGDSWGSVHFIEMRNLKPI